MARARRGNLDIQRNGFLATLVVAVTSATLLLSALGLFRLPNDLLFDAAVRIGLGERGVESTVLLVETTADPAGGDPAVWSRMLDELRRLGARRVVFTFDPALPGGGGEDVVIGHPGRPSERQPGAWTLAPSPNALAAAVIPAATYGIHRRQATAVATEEGGMVPTIEAWAAGLTPVSSGEVFLVRFGRSADDLPRVGIGRVLDGGLVATLVEGRTVLVGPGGTVAGRGLNTPITPDLAALTPLEFHAFATGSLLAGAAIRDVGWLGTAALPLVFSLAGAVVYRRASPRSALWLALGLPLPILLVAFVALLWADRMLPVAELLASQVALSLLVWRWREMEQDRALRRLLRETSAHVHERLMPPASEDEARLWSRTIELASRLLGLRRSILLVPEERSPGLRLLAAAGGRLEDIPEDCRRLDRPPYTTAVREGDPVPVDVRFLGPSSADEERYLAPVMGNGVPIAFWAYATDSGATTREPGLRAALSALADQLGAMLVETRADDARDETAATGTSLDRRVGEVVALLERRLDLLEGALSEISIDLAVFDMLGRVLHANERMTRWLDRLGWTPDQTPLDLLVRAGGISVEAARATLHRVVIEKGHATLAVRGGGEEGAHILRISAPQGAQLQSWGAAAAGPLGALVYERLDISNLMARAQLEGRLAQFLDRQLRNDQEAILLAADLLVRPDLPEERRGLVVARLGQAISRMRARLERAEVFLDDGGQHRVPAFYPIGPREPVEAAVRAVAAEAQARRVRLETRVPALPNPVLAGPEVLEKFLTAMLRLSVADAPEGGTVAVDLVEEKGWTAVTCAGRGVGLPAERLAELLRGGREPQSPALAALRRDLAEVETWGASFEASSAVGEGMSFRLRLHRME